MAIHFEELWEECEQFHQSNETEVSVAALIEALKPILELYQSIDAVENMTTEDKGWAKTRTLGELLMILTHLSLKDNINVFQALRLALHTHDITRLDQKHQ